MGEGRDVSLWKRLERVLVVLVAAHSYAVGVFLLFFPQLTLRMGGWDESVPDFFVRQGGAFHIVLATVYLIDYLRRGSVTTLLTAKSMATAFLGSMLLIGHDSWLVWIAMSGDAAMAASTYMLRRLAR